MAKQPASVPQRVREYYVYSTAKDIGVYKVVTREDRARVVLLTKAQAQYWLDQGVIGEKAIDKLSNDHHDLINQFSGGRTDTQELMEAAADEPAKNEQAKPKPAAPPELASPAKPSEPAVTFRG